MNILIISPVFPYPLDEGAKERIFQIIKGLSRQNKIHLVTFFRNQKELQYLSELDKYCARIDTVYNPSWSMLKTLLLNLLYFFSPTPTLMAMHQSREMKRRIESALANNHYDIVQIELTQMASYLPSPRRCHVEPFACHSERSEESHPSAQDKLHETSQRDSSAS
ncbi:MAG TPA: hypothetical protein VI387_05695, partial [Candidatus Brocadiales bacterium]|nr:hypothetical protein [Candidatus Brocadiales bacterium]